MDLTESSQAAGVCFGEAVVERTKLVSSILLNKDEKQVIAKTFDLFEIDGMYLQAEKVVGAWGFVGVVFFSWKGFVTVL